MGGVLAENSGIQLLASAKSEVAQGNGGCNGRILNKWHMKIWSTGLCLL
jgi:hypothetical protein